MLGRNELHFRFLPAWPKDDLGSVLHRLQQSLDEQTSDVAPLELVPGCCLSKQTPQHVYLPDFLSFFLSFFLLAQNVTSKLH